MNKGLTCRTDSSTGNIFKILVERKENVDSVVEELFPHFGVIATMPACRPGVNDGDECEGTEILAIGKTRDDSSDEDFLGIGSILKVIFPEDEERKGHLLEATTGIKIHESVCGCDGD